MDRDRRQRLDLGPEHLFELVLRDPLRVFGIQGRTRGSRIERVVELGKLVAPEPGHEGDGRRIVHPERGRLRQGAGETPSPQMRPCADVRGLRSRREADGLVSLDDEASDAAHSEFDRQGEPAGPRADDHDLETLTARQRRTLHRSICAHLPSPPGPFPAPSQLERSIGIAHAEAISADRDRAVTAWRSVNCSRRAAISSLRRSQAAPPKTMKSGLTIATSIPCLSRKPR